MSEPATPAAVSEQPAAGAPMIDPTAGAGNGANGSPAPADREPALRVYLRLLAYAKPHWPMFALGVFGMALFA